MLAAVQLQRTRPVGKSPLKLIVKRLSHCQSIFCLPKPEI